MNCDKSDITIRHSFISKGEHLLDIISLKLLFLSLRDDSVELADLAVPLGDILQTSLGKGLADLFDLLREIVSQCVVLTSIPY